MRFKTTDILPSSFLCSVWYDFSQRIPGVWKEGYLFFSTSFFSSFRYNFIVLIESFSEETLSLNGDTIQPSQIFTLVFSLFMRIYRQSLYTIYLHIHMIFLTYLWTSMSLTALLEHKRTKSKSNSFMFLYVE